MIRFVIVLLVILALAPSAGAQPAADLSTQGKATPPSTKSVTWEFSLKPYVFLSGLAGAVTAGGATFPVNSSFSDLVDNLRVGGFVSLAGTKGRWGFLADLEYISLKGESTGRVPAELRLDTTIGELDATFGSAPGFGLRFLGGVRLFDVSQSLRVADDPALEASATVVDPILGAVGTWELGDRWRFGMRGDIGGFGVGSEFTYQLMLEFQLRISGSVGLPFGYRVLGYQIRQESIQLDTRLGGLFLGLEFRF